MLSEHEREALKQLWATLKEYEDENKERIYKPIDEILKVVDEVASRAENVISVGMDTARGLTLAGALHTILIKAVEKFGKEATGIALAFLCTPLDENLVKEGEEIMREAERELVEGD